MQKPHPIATWNQDKDYWEEEQVDIFGHSVAYSETLPKSGTTRRGRLYELPTSALPITVPEFSSSPGQVLPTPVAQPSGNSPQDHLRKKPGRKRVTDLSILVENDLLETGGVPVLPTPTASEWKREDNPSQARRNSPGLTTVSVHFPTPSARDGVSGGDRHPAKRRAGGHTVNLTDAVMTFTGEPTLPLFDAGSD